MEAYKRKIRIKTSYKDELLDITHNIGQIVQESGIGEGVCFIFCPHTTPTTGGQ
jgi:thiamine phosphate synthase YjbQ (UPF0047 family)